MSRLLHLVALCVFFLTGGLAILLMTGAIATAHAQESPCTSRSDCVLQCPSGSTVTTEGKVDWCAQDDGKPGGPFVVWKSSNTNLSGRFKDGAPEGTWTLRDRGTVVIQAPAPTSVLECDGKPSCWSATTLKVFDKLSGRLKVLGEPALEYREAQGKRKAIAPGLWREVVSTTDFVHPVNTDRMGFGLLPGDIKVFDKNGQPQFSLAHDASGWVEGSVKVWQSGSVLLRSAVYSSGVLNGTEETWWWEHLDIKSGRKISVGKRSRVDWVDGALRGKIRMWDKFGQFIVQASIADGKPCDLFMVRGWSSTQYKIPPCPPR